MRGHHFAGIEEVQGEMFFSLSIEQHILDTNAGKQLS
jgi:hypothetical protein